MALVILEGFIGNDLREEQQWWSDKPTTYLRNRLGHRSAEPETVVSDPRGYLLATGCSVTEGVALDPDQIWCTMLAQQLGVNLYNLALGGTGLDVIQHNLQQWIWRYGRPRFLIRTEEISQQRFIRPGGYGLAPAGVWGSEDEQRFVWQGDQLGIWQLRSELMRELYLSDYQTVTLELPVIWDGDRALDGEHPGPACHQKMAQWARQRIIRQLKKRAI
jgi:hypothetical protein